MQIFDDSNSCASKYDNALYEIQYVSVYDKYIKPPLYIHIIEIL